MGNSNLCAITHPDGIRSASREWFVLPLTETASRRIISAALSEKVGAISVIGAINALSIS